MSDPGRAVDALVDYIRSLNLCPDCVAANALLSDETLTEIKRMAGAGTTLKGQVRLEGNVLEFRTERSKEDE